MTRKRRKVGPRLSATMETLLNEKFNYYITAKYIDCEYPFMGYSSSMVPFVTNFVHVRQSTTLWGVFFPFCNQHGTYAKKTHIVKGVFQLGDNLT